MKTVFYFLFLVVLIACTDSKNDKSSEDTSVKDNYMINDTLCDCHSLNIDRKRNIIHLSGDENPYSGWCVLYAKNKEIKAKRYYKDGMLDGDFLTYHPNGKLESSIPHKQNKYHGLYFKLNETGDTTYQRMYKNGIAD